METRLKVYLVGGAVRDELLGREVLERDWVVVGQTPDAMVKQGFKPVGKDFPVFLHPDTQEEYALARTERKTGKGYTGFSCYAEPSVTLEEDLLRRDLTINAIAKTPEGDIIDPFDGQKDLENKILRHVSPAFIEDPVRILRLARFAARFPDFSIASETKQLMNEMVKNGEVDALVPERVWKEFAKALVETTPQRFFEVLENCGAKPVLFPEISEIHGLLGAIKLSEHPYIRFAAMTHDISQDAIKALCKRLNCPRQYRDLALLVAKNQAAFHTLPNDDAQAIVELLQKLDTFRRPERLPEFILACSANDPKGSAQKTGKLLMQAFTAANQADTGPLLEQNLEGPNFAEALKKERIKLVDKALSENG